MNYIFKFSNDLVKLFFVVLKGYMKIMYWYEKEVNYIVEIIVSVLGYNKIFYVCVVVRKCGLLFLFFFDEYIESDF